jgi:mono/diheme cytochrome c family protein
MRSGERAARVMIPPVGFARKSLRVPLPSFPRKRESSRFNILRSCGWNPACAGMTESELGDKARPVTSPRLDRRKIFSTLAVLLAVASSMASPTRARSDVDGRRLYLRQCAPCHGETGAGDGADAPYFSAPPRDLREGFLSRYSSDDLVRRIREGRSLQLGVDLKALKERAADVESVVSHMKRLPAIDWRRVEAGWEAYVDRCEACHGPYGRPGRSLPPGVRAPRDLSDPDYQGKMTDQELLIAVRHGRDHMPALVPRVPEAEGPALVAFVRVLSPGFELYSRHCAACHGDDGRGVGSFIESLQVPTVIFDQAYFRRREPEQIRHAVWHMVGEHKPVMPHFRWNLTEAEARAIVEYLRKVTSDE